MSHTVEIKNTILELTLVATDFIGATDPAVLLLHQFLVEWGARGDMKDINFIQQIGDPLLYDWTAERKNGFTLTSLFTFDSGTDLDPEVTISLPSAWPLSVIQAGGPTRAQLIAIRARVGIENFRVVFA